MNLNLNGYRFFCFSFDVHFLHEVFVCRPRNGFWSSYLWKSSSGNGFRGIPTKSELYGGGKYLYFMAQEEDLGRQLYRIETINSVNTKALKIKVATNVFPNPSQNYIKVTEADVGHYRIYNSLGEVFQHGYMNNSLIQINELPNGMYFLELIDNQKRYEAIFVQAN